MSLLKPVAKQAKTAKPVNQMTTLQRAETVDTTQCDMEEERGRRTASLPDSLIRSSSTVMETAQSPRHPKGHKVRELADIWGTMDKSDFLRVTDTLTLDDVWVQPTLVEPGKGVIVNTTFKEIVAGPHIKFRDAACKISVDDLIKMLYLNDCIQCNLQNITNYSFEDWLKEKSSVCVKAKGMEEGSDRAKLCNFIITEDKGFTFYPSFLHGRFGIFFRKICYHSYKTKMAPSTPKISNLSMIKCRATRGAFEYVIEARLFPLPDEWFDQATPAATSMVDRCFPDSQPF